MFKLNLQLIWTTLEFLVQQEIKTKVHSDQGLGLQIADNDQPQ